MASRSSLFNPIAIPLLAILLGYLYTNYLHRTITVLGIFRKPVATTIAPEDFIVIDNTIHCEDLHYYEPAGLIFTACESYVGSRLPWFPGLAHLGDPSTDRMNGRLQIIDPKTFKSKNLALEGFSGPFVTHGIDVISDPAKPPGQAVYIFAINHKPNHQHFGDHGDAKAPKAHSVVELFHHVIGSDKAQHIRTIWHPLITTPNDLLAQSPTSFIITNDHYHREGLLRLVEDILPTARWTKVIHVQFDKAAPAKTETTGVKASIALDKIRNSNGISHGITEKDVLITSCTSGILHVGEIQTSGGNHTIKVNQVIEFDTAIDNPSYFSDPYATDDLDASSYVACGSTRPIEFPYNKLLAEALDPIMVMKTSSTKGAQGGKPVAEIIFQDDGHRIRTASTSVLVAIDPKEEGGKRRAWLFVSGYMAKNAIAVKIDL